MIYYKDIYRYKDIMEGVFMVIEGKENGRYFKVITKKHRKGLIK